MTRLINKLSGGEMWVADDRVEKYLAAGHRLAASPEEKAAGSEAEPEGKKPAQKPKRRKTTR